MISSDTCAYCVQARAWFNAHDVPFSECSIERDAACAARFAALLAPGTPVILVRERPQVGFSPPRVAEALRRS
jgi:glutaredoxin